MSIVFTGTATAWDDLLTKVVAHLQHASLGTEAWTLLATDTTSVANEKFVYLKGPGLSASENIYVNIRQYRDIAGDYYNWQLRGAVSYNGALTFATQPGFSPPANVCLWQSSIPYWLIANGRRFILVAKVSTTYATAYGGFILPYATPTEMPYPMFVGGNASTSTKRWSAGDYTLGGFWDAPSGTTYLRHFDGSWLEIYNYSAGGTRNQTTISLVWPFEIDMNIGKNVNGNYSLLPSILHSSTNGGNVYGELEGVFFTSGAGVGAEDILQIGGDNYLVVPSVYRNGARDYCAIKLG